MTEKLNIKDAQVGQRVRMTQNYYFNPGNVATITGIEKHEHPTCKGVIHYEYEKHEGEPKETSFAFTDEWGDTTKLALIEQPPATPTEESGSGGSGGGEQTEYTVAWYIEVVASSPIEAAQEARDIQQDRENQAGVFYIHEFTGAKGLGKLIAEVDLNALDEEAEQLHHWVGDIVGELVERGSTFSTRDVLAELLARHDEEFQTDKVTEWVLYSLKHDYPGYRLVGTNPGPLSEGAMMWGPSSQDVEEMPVSHEVCHEWCMKGLRFTAQDVAAEVFRRYPSQWATVEHSHEGIKSQVEEYITSEFNVPEHEPYVLVEVRRYPHGTVRVWGPVSDRVEGASPPVVDVALPWADEPPVLLDPPSEL